MKIPLRLTDTALLLWSRVISHTGLFKKIISEIDPKFTSALWTNLHRFFGTKTSFSTAYHPQTDGLSERMIQTLEEMIRIPCAYGLEFKDSNGFTHDWCTLIPALELAYKTSIHSSTGQTPVSSFNIMLDKVKYHAKKSINDAFYYAKQKWDKSHKVPDFKVGDLVLVSTLNFNNIKGPKTLQSHKVPDLKVGDLVLVSTLNFNNIKGPKTLQSHKVPDFKVGDLVLVSTLNFNNIKGPKTLQDSYVRPFVIVSLPGTKAVQVELSGELENKHPTFPVNLIKPYQPAKNKLVPLRNPTPLTESPVEQSEDKKIKKVIKERRLRGENQREYIFRYRIQVHEDEWLAKSEIPDSDILLRGLRLERRPQG
ncbi:hypothetical protein O181_041029 [Austropuccinia psidii MF-1]|uniref:Integrase catalytic domain-containing protein n=1 Tax=Austropuccinia psidii MF-1 TaxID=1389203 RepID=A0A9Q3DDM0_9BASI|nr:hypothetical protein [Austropuccinia psidii MF-1]